MITSIFNLRSVGFIHTSTTDTTVVYTKYLPEKWEVVELINEGYTVKKNGVVKYSSGEFKEVVKFLKDKKVI